MRLSVMEKLKMDRILMAKRLEEVLEAACRLNGGWFGYFFYFACPGRRAVRGSP